MTVQALGWSEMLSSKKILPKHEEVRTGLDKQLDLVPSSLYLIPWGSWDCFRPSLGPSAMLLPHTHLPAQRDPQIREGSLAPAQLGALKPLSSVTVKAVPLCFHKISLMKAVLSWLMWHYRKISDVAPPLWTGALQTFDKGCLRHQQSDRGWHSSCQKHTELRKAP